MDMSFTWKYSTAAALAPRLTQEKKEAKAAVNRALVVKAGMNPLELVAKKVAAPIRWHWMRPSMQFVAAPD